MGSEAEEVRYPHRTKRVYLNIATVALAVLLAGLTFPAYPEWPALLLYYLFFTLFITTIVYLLRTRLLPTRLIEAKDGPRETKAGTPWTAFILLFCAVLALLAIPLLLASVLPPQSWFIFIIGLISGLSISDMLVYFTGGEKRR